MFNLTNKLIVPDVIANTPSGLLKVTYSNDEEVVSGSTLTYEEILGKETPSQSAPWYLVYQDDLELLKNIRLHWPYYFRVMNHISFDNCHLKLQFKREEARLSLLFSNNKKVSIKLSHNSTFSSPDPIFCTLYFGPHFFSGS